MLGTVEGDAACSRDREMPSRIVAVLELRLVRGGAHQRATEFRSPVRPCFIPMATGKGFAMPV